MTSGRTLAVTIATLSAALGLGATAAAHPPSDPFAVKVARGHDLARSNCSSCHAVEPSGVSPNRRAPPFRTISGRYVELTLNRKLTEIAETGHYDMPPVPVHSDQIEALAAYINSLPPPE